MLRQVTKFLTPRAFWKEIKEFTDVYEPVASISFSPENLGEVTHYPIDTPFATTRRCVFCEKGAPDAKFGSISHIVPESLGNKHFRYTLECDACNGEFGRLLEQELLNELYAIRAFARKPGKTRDLKFKIKPYDSFIQFIYGSPLRINSFVHEDAVEIIEKPRKNEFTLRIKVPPVNVVAAIKSIAKMGLMLLPYLELQRSRYLIDWIRGKSQYLPVYYRGFIPGAGLEYTTLAIFRSRADLIGVAPYFIIFMYANILYYLPLPGATFTRPANVMLPPPYVFNVYGGSIDLHRLVCDRDEKTQRKPVEMNFYYSRKE